MLSGAAGLSLVLALGTYFIRFETLVPHYGAIIRVVEPFETWSTGPGWPNYGGNPHALFAAMALILTCVASIRSSQQSADRTATASIPDSIAPGQLAKWT
jgi:hypothetical protein